MQHNCKKWHLESQISFISTIRFYESIYLGQMDNKEKGVIKGFIKRHIVPKGILLFHSPYIADNAKQLTLPLATKVHDDLSDCMCFPSCLKVSVDSQDGISATFGKRLVEWYLGKDEIEGTQEFLENARNILINERSQKVEERRLQNKKNRKKNRREQKLKINSKIESIDDSIKKMVSQNSC